MFLFCSNIVPPLPTYSHHELWQCISEDVYDGRGGQGGRAVRTLPLYLHPLLPPRLPGENLDVRLGNGKLFRKKSEECFIRLPLLRRRSNIDHHCSISKNAFHGTLGGSGANVDGEGEGAFALKHFFEGNKHEQRVTWTPPPLSPPHTVDARDIPTFFCDITQSGYGEGDECS